LRIDPIAPEQALIDQCIELLRQGEVIVCPTDTVYAYVCNCENPRAIEKLAKLKGVRLKHANLSLICTDLSELSRYTRQVSTPHFRVMKQALPGPYTFVLQASSMIPALFKNKKRTIGIRVPDDAICNAICAGLGNALAATSVHTSADDVQDHFSDPAEIGNEKGHTVNLVIDGGFRGVIGSTVIDLSGEAPEVLREGRGSLNIL